MCCLILLFNDITLLCCLNCWCLEAINLCWIWKELRCGPHIVNNFLSVSVVLQTINLRDGLNELVFISTVDDYVLLVYLRSTYIVLVCVKMNQNGRKEVLKWEWNFWPSFINIASFWINLCSFPVHNHTICCLSKTLYSM